MMSCVELRAVAVEWEPTHADHLSDFEGYTE